MFEVAGPWWELVSETSGRLLLEVAPDDLLVLFSDGLADRSAPSGELFGAGRLRKAVAGLLDGHPHVATWRPGHPNEGGGGATIVEIKD